MNIFNLFTKTNLKILKLIDKEPLHIRELADRLKISPASVHKFAKILKKEDLAKEVKQKNMKIIRLNKENPLVKQLKSLINLDSIINTHGYKELKKFGTIGIYGSFANGTNDNESDLDIWVCTEKKEVELRPIARELEKQMNTKVSLLILSKSKIESLRKNDPEFYTRLKLTSIGGKID